MRRVLVAAVLVLAVTTAAVAVQPVIVKPRKSDPLETGIITSAWVPHTGLVGTTPRDRANHGLVLQKEGTTATTAYANVIITGVKGQAPNALTLGFDRRKDGHCTANSPRFVVTTSDGATQSFGCTAGASVDLLDPTWARVTFDLSTAVFGAGTTVTAVNLVFDEGTDTVVDTGETAGSAILDNVRVNTVYAGKPGAAR